MVKSSHEIQFSNWPCELSFPSSSGFHLHENQLFGSYAGEMECLQDQRLYFHCNYFMLYCIKDIQISLRLSLSFDANYFCSCKEYENSVAETVIYMTHFCGSYIFKSTYKNINIYNLTHVKPPKILNGHKELLNAVKN